MIKETNVDSLLLSMTVEGTREKERMDMISEGLKKITKYKDLELEKVTDEELQKLGCDVVIINNNEIKTFADFKHYNNNNIVVELLNIKHNPKWYKGYPYMNKNSHGWSISNKKKTQFIIYTTDERIVMFNYYKLRKYIQDNLFKFLDNINSELESSFKSGDNTFTKQKSYSYKGLFESVGHRKNDKLIDELIKNVGCWIYDKKNDTIETVKGTMKLSEQDIIINKNNFVELKEIYQSKKNNLSVGSTQVTRN